ncbi:heparin lyase I family protein [Flavivirga spongiicola]|uniref:Polysaccharide lyase n=1 Tax=Flavivirga spongiicola TaxID=421621 RepID=A0ABU7XX96_9FLAO|nr:heparin lyase I family protein [Flavivirga sp. MEBiC05379]MDO5980030.1 heparin lyase I family protein [Flavivirga sp. MEBiC05379]
MKRVYLCFFMLIALLSCAQTKKQSKKLNVEKEITSRSSAQKDVASASDIVDGRFIVIGNRSPSGIVTREETKKGPIYHFKATGDANRIEFSPCFGSKENLKDISQEEIELLKKIKSAYEYDDEGQYGETVTYEWEARFPEKMIEGKGGIFAQWHGRPDRTLVKDPKGNLQYLPKEKFVAMLDTVYFEKNVGMSIKDNKPNGWFVDNSAGGPIAAFHFRPDYMYLMVRTEANRISNPTFKVKPKPGIHLNQLIGKDGKYGTIVFEKPSSEVPINEWIKFKVKIKYSKYSKIADEVLKSGGIQVWMNGEKVADWKGNIGKNDLHGPYFKYGIYKPGKLGFKVDCKKLIQTINR